MTSYGYVALNRVGKEIKGSLEAESEAEVVSQLKSKGLTPIEVSKQSFLTQDIDLNIGGNVTPRDLSVFCRQFVSMQRAGISIIEAMRLLAEQTENKKLQKAITGVQVNLEKGSGLAESMEEYPKVFSSLMVNSIAAGEATGSLDVSFERMATQLERTAKTQAAVKKAMIYPIMVCIVAVVVVILMLVKIIPSYAEMFEQMDTELPGLTLAMIGLSNFIIKNWLVLIIIVVGLVLGIKYYAGTDHGKHFFGQISIQIPIFGKMNKKSASALLARTLSTLISSGVPLEEAVEITARVMPNILFKDALMDARNQILQGIPLSKPLEECGLFPPMVYHMIRIGEEAGSVSEMLTKLADYYDEEVEQNTQAMMAAMEPLIIVVLAAVVGTMIGACMAPMLKMYSSLNNL